MARTKQTARRRSRSRSRSRKPLVKRSRSRSRRSRSGSRTLRRVYKHLGDPRFYTVARKTAYRSRRHLRYYARPRTSSMEMKRRLEALSRSVRARRMMR